MDTPTRPVRKSPAGAGLVVLVVAALIGFFVMKPKNVERWIPLVVESRIPLLERLESSEQRAGFPEHERWIQPWIVAAHNVDDTAVPILLPETGAVAFPDLPVHGGARLRGSLAVEFAPPKGLEWSPATIPATAGASTVAFEITARRGGGDSKTVHRESLEVRPGDALPLRKPFVAALPAEWVGSRVEIVITTSTRRDRAAEPGEYWFPAIGSPTLESEGTKARVGELEAVVETTTLDLLREFPRALAADDDLEEVALAAGPDSERIFAVRKFADGRTEEIGTVQRAAVPAFVAAEKQEGESWGAYPGLLFGLDGVVVRYAVDVPASGPALRFRIGIDRRCIGVGSADFAVTVDGERVWSAALDPGRTKADAGWRDVSVDLSRWAGRKVKLALEGALQHEKPRTIASDGSSDSTAGGATASGGPSELEVRRVQAAFAEPRIVSVTRATRRLAAKKDPPRPSVVYVNIETLRADVLGCYGGESDVCPELDRLAREGARVDPCISVAPWTAPSVASVFTGLYPYAHGVISYSQSYLPDSLDTLAERAAREGVTTAAFVTNDLISPRKNFDQGFETFDLIGYANAKQVVATFEDWLVDHADLQFFAYLHLFEPHDPCNAPGDDRERYVPEELRGKDPRAALARVQQRIAVGDPPEPSDPDVRLLRGRYLGEIRYVDRQLGRLRQILEERKLLERVVVIVTSDHGEEFCEHGLIGHGSHCFRESVAVPLVVWGPGFVPAGLEIAGPIENTALYATTLDLLGVPYDSRAVEPALRFDGSPQSGSAYSSTEQGIRAIVPPLLKTKTIHRLETRTRSFVFSPRGNGGEPAECAAYDLESDPAERQDRSHDPGFDLATLKRALESAWKFAHSEMHGLIVDELDSTTADLLKQMGYAAGSRTNAAGALFAPDDDCGPK